MSNIACHYERQDQTLLTTLLESFTLHIVRLLLASLPNYGLIQASVLPEVVFRPTTEGSVGAVASESIECSTIGRDLLARGVSVIFPLVIELHVSY